MQKFISKRKLIIVAGMLLFAIILAVFATMQAYRLSQQHTEMLSFKDSISSSRLDHISTKYQSDYEIYYAIASLSGIYAVADNNRFYDEMKMERWTVEIIGDSTGSIILSVPEISWNPKYVDLKEGGWQLSGEIGSHILLYHPKLNPNNAGRLTLEVIGRNARGVVFLIGQPIPSQP